MTASSGDHRSSAPPASLGAAVTLRVMEARVEDIGHAIARLAPDDLARIGARAGDILRVSGGTVAVARAELSAPGTEGQSLPDTYTFIREQMLRKSHVTWLWIRGRSLLHKIRAKLFG